MTNSKYENISEIEKLFQQGDVKEISKLLWDIHRHNIEFLSKNNIPELFDYFDFNIISHKDFQSVKSLLSILGFLGYYESMIYKKIVKKIIEKDDHLENIIDFLIYKGNLRIFTIEELGSLSIKKLSINIPDKGIPEEIGYIKSLEHLKIYSEEEFPRIPEEFPIIPESIQHLINLKILDLGGANLLKNLSESILKLVNLRTIILPRWNNVFELPEWIHQMYWVENIQFEIEIFDKPILFNLAVFIGIFKASEMKAIFEKFYSLERQDYNDYTFPINILEMLKGSLNSSKTDRVRRQIENFIVDFIKINYNIIFYICDSVYVKDDDIRERSVELIGKKFSSLFKKVIKDSLKKGDDSEIYNIIFNKWLLLLEKVDFIDLLKDPEVDLLKKLLKCEDAPFGFEKEIDDIILEYILERLTPSESQAIRDLSEIIDELFLPVCQRYSDEVINAFEFKDQKVRSLFIRGSDLDHLPASIGNLINLEKLEINGTNLNILPETIGQLTNLTELNLYNNKLKNLPESLVNLSSLTNLDISHNLFEDFPHFLEDLVSLKFVLISGNKIKYIHPNLQRLLGEDEIENFKYERENIEFDINGVKHEISTHNENFEDYEQNKEFDVNKNLKLKLISNKTTFYINNKKFLTSSLLYLQVPHKDIKNLSDLLTKYPPEVLAEKFKSLFDDGEYENNMSGLVSAEEEFKLTCLNLQLWAENIYDYRLLHPELAVPLIKELVYAGDPIAKNVIKKVLTNIFTFGLPKFIRYLAEPIYDNKRGNEWQNHMSILTQTDLMDGLLNPLEATTMKEIITFTETEHRVLYEGWWDDDFLRRYIQQYHFLVENNSVVSMDMELNQRHPSIPDSIENLKSLNSLRIIVNGSFDSIDFNRPIESLESLKLYIWGDVKVPNKFHLFPNLRFLTIRFIEGGSFKDQPTTLGSLKILRSFSLDGIILKEFPRYLLNLKRLRSAEFRDTGLTELPEDLKITRKYRFSFYNSLRYRRDF